MIRAFIISNLKYFFCIYDIHYFYWILGKLDVKELENTIKTPNQRCHK